MNYKDFWEAGYRVIGLNKIIKNNLCSCGQAGCKAIGKHPIASNWQYAPLWSEEQIETMEATDQFATGYGVLVKGLLVIDVDARNGGVESYQRLIEQFPDITGAGMIVETGSGGGSNTFTIPPQRVWLCSSTCRIIRALTLSHPASWLDQNRCMSQATIINAFTARPATSRPHLLHCWMHYVNQSATALNITARRSTCR